MSETAKTLIIVAATAAITALVSWFINSGTAQYDAGADAETRNIVREEIKAAMITDSGLTFSQEIQNAKLERNTILTNQGHILEAVRSLSEE